MQSLCPFVVPFLAAEEMLLNVHVCPTLIFFKGLKFYTRHLLCVKSLSSDNSRIVSIFFFYCNSGGHSTGSIQKDAAHWTGAMGRVEFIPQHTSPGCALPSLLLPCLLGAALCWWVRRKQQLYHGGQQRGGTVWEALVTKNKHWNVFFLKLLIPLGISEPGTESIHLVKKWCHLWQQ